MTIILSGIAFLIWVVASSLTLWGTWLVLRHFKDARRVEKPSESPGISILKPLKGLDYQLEENLRTFFELKYPTFELVFAIQDRNDPATAIVERLQVEYPHVKSLIVSGGSDFGRNPKVNNLMPAYHAAHYDRILISDSNTRISVALISNLLGSLEQKNHGIVTAIVSGQSGRSFGALLEANYLNTFYTRWMLLSHWAGFPCVIGKAMMFRKSLAERFGGLSNLGQYLAEDYMAGLAVKFLGYEIGISRAPVEQSLGALSLKTFWKRHLRWGRIRKAQAPLAFLGEPLMTCVVSGLMLASWTHAPWLFWVHVSIWGTCDWIIAHQIHRSSLIPHVFSWVIREALAPLHWLHMAIDNTVEWRGRRLTLDRGGVLKH